MGMFDTVNATKFKLPTHPDWVRLDCLQTKGFECDMDNYHIDENGQLWIEDFEIEDQSDPTKTGWGRFVGMMSKVRVELIKRPFTGVITMYDYNSKNSQSADFTVEFFRGKVQSVEFSLEQF